MRAQRLSAFAAIVGALGLLVSLIGSCFAHEGHNHGDEKAAVPANVIPRAEARSDAFELVATASGNQITLYLNHSKTNEPIVDATVEAETPEGPATAEAQKDGTYTIKAPWLVKGGHFDLIFTVTAGEASDVLTLVVDVPNGSAVSAAQRAGPRATDLLKPAVLLPAAIGFALGILMMLFGRRSPLSR